MREIERAGIGEIVVSWWGRGSGTDERLPAVIAAAGTHLIEVAAHLEPYAGRTVASSIDDVRYLRTLGVRDFFVYHATDFPAAEWQPLTSAFSGVRFFAQTPLAGYAKTAGFQGIYTYDPLTYRARSFARICKAAHKQNLLCGPSVGPGYSATRATGDTRVLSRAGGRTYDSMWSAARRAGADLVTITSYNEWNEGTQIEPACPRVGLRELRRRLGRKRQGGGAFVLEPHALLGLTFEARAPRPSSHRGARLADPLRRRRAATCVRCRP